MENKTISVYVRKSFPLLAVIMVIITLLTGLFPITAPKARAADDTADWSFLQSAVTGSDLIALGTVQDKISYWDDGKTGIHTSVVVSVNETLKGKAANSDITVTFAGGEADGTGEWFSDMPGFNEGDSAVLFLNKIPRDQVPAAGALTDKLTTDQYSIYDGYQGKYSAVGGKVGSMALSDFTGMIKQLLQGHLADDGVVPVVLSGASVPYSYSGKCWPHPPAPNIHYRIDENAPGCTGEAAAIEAAMATWNAAGAAFTFTYDGPTTATAYNANGVNEIFWGNMAVGTLAVNCIWYNPATLKIFESDIEFNNNYNWSTSAICPPGYYDVQTIATHELGHTLMLNDLYGVDDANKVMCGYGVPGTTKRVLTADDIAGIYSIYGAAVAPPVVTNEDADEITTQSARLNGEVNLTGGENPAVHIFWGPSDGGNVAGNWANDLNFDALETGLFSANITGLSAGTTYYYRCYVINSAGDNWSYTTGSFTTMVSLTMAVSGNGTITPEPGEHDYNQGSSVNLTAQPAANWAFASWSGNVSGNTISSTNITLNRSENVTAYFYRVNGTLNLMTNGDGSISMATGNYTYPVHTSFDISAAPAPGWRFKNWTGDTAALSDASSANATITINGDYNITAVFDRPVLTVVANGGGNVWPPAGPHPYDIGSNVTLAATPAVNWVFLNWNGDASQNSTIIDVTIDTDTTVTANFLRVAGNLITSVSGSGDVTPAPGFYTYDAGATVNIAAVPAPGWQFVQWSGDTGTVSNINSDNTTLTISGDYNITAIFAQIGVTIPGVGGGGGGGGSISGGSAADDKTITGLRTLISDDGRVFDDIQANSYDALATIDIPPGTTAKNKAGSALPIITITDVKQPDAPQPGMSLVGNVYDFQPAGATFSPAIPLTIMYNENELPKDATPDMLCIALWDSASKTYQPVPFTIDKKKHVLTALISHFSRYTLLALPRPANFVFSNLVITPASVELYDDVDISVDIANAGDLSGNYTAAVILKDAALNPQTIILNGGEKTTLHFKLKTRYEGVNQITVGGLKGSFTVTLTPPAFTIVSITMSASQVDIGQNVEVKTIISNTGEQYGLYKLIFRVNGAPVDTQQVVIAGQTARMVIFSYTPKSAGRDIVTVNDIADNLLVNEPPPPPPPTAPPAVFATPAVTNELPAKADTAPLANNRGVITGVCAACLVLALVVYFTQWRKRTL